MAIFVTNMGLWMEGVALQDVSSIEAAIIYTLEPVGGWVGGGWGGQGDHPLNWLAV